MHPFRMSSTRQLQNDSCLSHQNCCPIDHRSALDPILTSCFTKTSSTPTPYSKFWPKMAMFPLHGVWDMNTFARHPHPFPGYCGCLPGGQSWTLRAGTSRRSCQYSICAGPERNGPGLRSRTLCRARAPMGALRPHSSRYSTSRDHQSSDASIACKRGATKACYSPVRSNMADFDGPTALSPDKAAAANNSLALSDEPHADPPIFHLGN